MLCCSFIARNWLETTVSLQKCDICQATSNIILPARVFWESKQTRSAALLSVIYTVNSRAVLPSRARMPRWCFHLLLRVPLGFCLFGLPPLGGYRVHDLGLIYGKTINLEHWFLFISHCLSSLICIRPIQFILVNGFWWDAIIYQVSQAGQ